MLLLNKNINNVSCDVALHCHHGHCQFQCGFVKFCHCQCIIFQCWQLDMQFYCDRYSCSPNLNLPTCHLRHWSCFVVAVVVVIWLVICILEVWPNLISSWGVFHQAFCQCFSLTNFISYWNPCIWLAESKFVSEKHWQNAWWNAPQGQSWNNYLQVKFKFIYFHKSMIMIQYMMVNE